MRKIKLAIIIALFLMMNCLTSQSANAQTGSVSVPTTTTKKLTDQQLRQLVVKALDSAEFNKNKANDLERKIKELADADAETIAALEKERDGYKNTAALLTEQAAGYKAALEQQKLATSEAENGRDIAIREVDRQKKKVSFWRKATRYAAIIGAGAGAAAVLILQR